MYWDIVCDVIHKIDDENLNIYVNIYPYEDESKILVFDDCDSQKQFNKLLKERMQDIPEVKADIDDFIYNVNDRDDWFIDEAVGGDANWTYSDEGFVCDECYKWHFYNINGACSYANYKAGDGYIICEDCITSCKENMEEYLKDMIDNPESANTILDDGTLYDLDFDKVNEWPYADGWYGRSANPKKILKEAQDLYPHCEFVFSIRKTYNPWETEFDLWKREVA